MGINVGEFNPPGMGSARLEISNNDEFIRRYKETNREARRKGITEVEKHWKIRHLGDRVPAAIQRLIDASNGVMTPMSQLDKPTRNADDLKEVPVRRPNGSVTDPLGEAIKDLEAVQQEHGIEVPPNPGPQIEGDIKPREKPKINPFTGQPVE
jgi:hypothetical protein